MQTKTIYKPALIRQLFEIGCSSSGELLSLNKVLGQLQDAGNVTTLAGYLEVLAECHLLTGLQKYAHDTARKYNSISKFQIFNIDLLTAYAGRSFAKKYTDPQRWSRWVESAIGAYLVGQAIEKDYKVFYWRNRNDEVDFILLKRGNLVAIEVKSGRWKMNDGLPLFTKQFSPKRSLVVGSGGIDLETFLTLDMDRLF